MRSPCVRFIPAGAGNTVYSPSINGVLPRSMHPTVFVQEFFGQIVKTWLELEMDHAPQFSPQVDLRARCPRPSTQAPCQALLAAPGPHVSPE